MNTEISFIANAEIETNYTGEQRLSVLTKEFPTIEEAFRWIDKVRKRLDIKRTCCPTYYWIEKKTADGIEFEYGADFFEFKPTRKTLLDLKVSDYVFFFKDKEDTAKATASQLKRKGLALFKTKATETGIYLTRLQ